MNDKLRKVDVNGFIMNSLLDEAKRIKEELETLEKSKIEKETEINNYRTLIEGLEKDLYSIGENIRILKENKANLMDKAEEVKKERTL